MSIDNYIKRINPRRAYLITAAGIKRITLGTTADFIAHEKSGTHQNTSKPLRTPKQPKTYVLAIAHSDRGMLDDHARQAIAAAAILADTDTAVVALVLGELREDLANAGADQVIVIPELDYQHFQPDVELACVTEVITSLQPIRIFMPDNLIGDGDLGRRLIASQPEKSAVTHVVEINAEHLATYQTGNSMLAFTNLPNIVLLAPDAVDTRLPFSAEAKRYEDASANQIQPEKQGQAKNKAQSSLFGSPYNTTTFAYSPYRSLGMQTISAAQIALEEADFILSAGNGVNNVPTFENLALLLDAAIGASRVAVDDGKFTRDKQVGASGKIVSASTYIAIGISGAVQHLQGIKDCRHVIVINRDDSAPIVKRADLSVIGDAEAIMQALITAITEAKLPALQEAA